MSDKYIHMVQSVLDGCNVCIIGCEQTGRTFAGTMQRGVQELFKIIERDSSKFLVSVSMLQLVSSYVNHAFRVNPGGSLQTLLAWYRKTRYCRTCCFPPHRL